MRAVEALIQIHSWEPLYVVSLVLGAGRLRQSGQDYDCNSPEIGGSQVIVRLIGAKILHEKPARTRPAPDPCAIREIAS
jgi:hypothetical protein